MRWPWQRRRTDVVGPATRELREAQNRLQRAREDTARVERAAERMRDLPAAELVRRLAVAFEPRREHD